ncbi:MAG: SMP-30/gluconolactonase/LRE family protein [Lachnospiraceae bacterium]|jgi:gluconolactonase|nr:SMP-30/gluconolactonase/LRE family protein [Lachnospiraceae bacterium]
MRADNPLKDFYIDREKIRYIGTDLQRPECILAEPDGSLWAADARGGVCHIRPDGSQEIITQKYAEKIQQDSGNVNRFFEGTLPNGLAFDQKGDILISNFGTDCLEIMDRKTGDTKVLFDTIDGKPIGKVNFVYRDSKNRIWITVTTMKKNWLDALDPDLADGYLARYDERGVHIVADGLRFTNEVRFDAKEEYLYVVETTGGRILKFACDENGDLHDRQVFGPIHMGRGAYPDGIAFDEYGNLWGTCVYSDKIWVIDPDGEYRVLLDEGDPAKVKALDEAFCNKCVTNEILFETGRGIAPWMASLTFGGRDRKNVYIGSLRATTIPYFESPVPGLPMVHWK